MAGPLVLIEGDATVVGAYRNIQQRICLVTPMDGSPGGWWQWLKIQIDRGEHVTRLETDIRKLSGSGKRVSDFGW